MTDPLMERQRPLTPIRIALFTASRTIEGSVRPAIRASGWHGDNGSPFWIPMTSGCPKKLETQIHFFSQNPEALICQTEEIWIRNGRRVNPLKKHQKFSGDIFAPSLRLCLVSPSAVMIKRDLFDQVGCFDETLPACEDYDLWLRISAQFPIFLIDQPLVVKRGGHPDQLSRTTPALDRFRIQALVKILNSGAINGLAIRPGL